MKAAINSCSILHRCQLPRRVPHLVVAPSHKLGTAGSELGSQDRAWKTIAWAHELHPRGGAKLKVTAVSPVLAGRLAVWPGKGLHLVKVVAERAPGWPERHSWKFALAAGKFVQP